MNYLKPDYRKDFFVYTNIDYEVMDSHELEWPGGRLNKKDGLTRYGDSHVKDKTS